MLWVAVDPEGHAVEIVFDDMNKLVEYIIEYCFEYIYPEDVDVRSIDYDIQKISTHHFVLHSDPVFGKAIAYNLFGVIYEPSNRSS